MAKTLRDIETSVRDIVQDDKVVLTAGFGLKMFNQVYRNLVAKFPWPERIVSDEITSTTVPNQESYAWTASGFPTFMDVTAVEMKTPTDASPTPKTDVFGVSSYTESTQGTTFKLIPPAPNELEWSIAGRLPAQQTPRYYRRIYDAANKISFRPVPSTSGYAIKITGVVEPTELTTQTGTTGTTIFLQRAADDALEHLLAASWLFKYKNIDQGNFEMSRASDILQTIFTNEKITSETIKDIV